MGERTTFAVDLHQPVKPCGGSSSYELLATHWQTEGGGRGSGRRTGGEWERESGRSRRDAGVDLSSCPA
jgi:hypothetical protein